MKEEKIKELLEQRKKELAMGESDLQKLNTLITQSAAAVQQLRGSVAQLEELISTPEDEKKA